MEDDTFELISAGWRTGTIDRYERALVKFEEFLMTKGISLDSVTVNNGLDYLANLVNRGADSR